MLDFPRPEIEPTSPALAGRFLTPGPAGKSYSFHFSKMDIIGGIISTEGTLCKFFLIIDFQTFFFFFFWYMLEFLKKTPRNGTQRVERGNVSDWKQCVQAWWEMAESPAFLFPLKLQRQLLCPSLPPGFKLRFQPAWSMTRVEVRAPGFHFLLSCSQGMGPWASVSYVSVFLLLKLTYALALVLR